jgi:ankyrin repeat protein
LSKPPRPDLEQYKKQAKELLAAIRKGDSEALRRLRQFHPRKIDPAAAVLADTQLVLAREHDCESWPKFKRCLAAATGAHLSPDELRERFVKSVRALDAVAVRELLLAHPELKALIDEPLFDSQPAIVCARRHRAVVDALLDHGTDINARSQFWGRTIGVLDDNSAEMRQYLLYRGAVGEVTAFVEAVQAGDVKRVDQLLSGSPALRAQIDRPLFSFGAPAIVASSSSRQMVDVLLKHGADINARSHWAPGSFGVLDHTPPQMADYLISRGAVVDIHAACQLGKFDRVKELLAADPLLVNGKGGDGQRPLHFASTREIIDYLLAHGAEIDARDLDHNATAAQYAVDAEWKCRYLIDHGASIDIFMAAALGDTELIDRALREYPNAIAARIGRGGYPPTARGAAAHIYLWKLGGELSPHEVALKRNHRQTFDLLMARSPLRVRFLVACAAADEAAVRGAQGEQPGLAATLTPDEQQLLIEAADCRNLAALRVMLDAGFSIDAVNDEGMTSLERASLRGYVDVVQFLCQRGASLTHHHSYGGDAVDTCIWGSLNFNDRNGDYPATLEALIAAGASVPEQAKGTAAVNDVLRRHGTRVE